MGIAKAETVGTDYETLFHAADQALYTVKRSGRGTYRFYDHSMEKMLSAISPINDGQEPNFEQSGTEIQGGESK